MGVDDTNDGVKFDVAAIRKGVQTIVAANGITTDAAWDAFIAGRTDAQLLNLLRGFFQTLIKIG